MTISYKFTPLNKEGKQDTVIKIDSTKTQRTFIPFDEANIDYIEYKKWVNGEDPYTEKGTTQAAD